MSRDAGVTCPSLWIARQLSSFRPGSQNAITVWLYRFDFNNTNPGNSVGHGGELDVVWNRNSAFHSETSRSVSSAIGEMWASFVANGTPSVKRRSHWPEVWPAFRDAEEEQFLNITGSFPHSDEAVVEPDASHYSGLYGDTCESWENYIRQGATQSTNFNTFGYLC